MGVRPTSGTAVLLPSGGQWLIEVETFDVDGRLVDATPTAVVHLPGGATATPAVENVATGRYRAVYPVTDAGRHVAVVSADIGSAGFAAYVTAITTEAGMPTVDDVADYLGDSAASWTTDELQAELDAEASAQRAVCSVGAVYPADLRQALLRRVQRSLAMRGLPLAVLQGDADLGPATPPGRDPEIRRREAPYRRLVVG